MTEAHVSDELAFAALPDSVRELCKRLYGGTPEEVTGWIDQYEHELFVARNMGIPPMAKVGREK